MIHCANICGRIGDLSFSKDIYVRRVIPFTKKRHKCPTFQIRTYSVQNVCIYCKKFLVKIGCIAVQYYRFNGLSSKKGFCRKLGENFPRRSKVTGNACGNAIQIHSWHVCCQWKV